MTIEKCINEFDVDDVIFEEGSTGRELFVVLDGQVEIRERSFPPHADGATDGVSKRRQTIVVVESGSDVGLRSPTVGVTDHKRAMLPKRTAMQKPSDRDEVASATEQEGFSTRRGDAYRAPTTARLAP